MMITKGIIIDAGADLINDSSYDDKVKVRVPELHGLGEVGEGFKEKEELYTKDEDLPWARIVPTTLDKSDKYPMLTYKAKYYSPGDIVYIQDSDGLLVLGSCTRYVEGSTEYNGLNVSKIVENASEFPASLLGESSNGGSNSDDGDSSGDGGSDSTSVVNTTEWKTVFGCPFTKKSQYRITARFPKYNSGGNHSGIDLAGSSGTPIYAAGDGTVVKVNSMGGAFGNHCVVDHGTHKGIRLYTLYAHMVSTPCVRVGQKVKGTQLAVPEWKKDTYYKFLPDSGKGSYVLVNEKPSDWEKVYDIYFIKSGSKYERVSSTPQKGTQLGKRGSTGNSTGPHLHFMITKSLSYISNSQVNSGYILNPEKFISF